MSPLVNKVLVVVIIIIIIIITEGQGGGIHVVIKGTDFKFYL